MDTIKENVDNWLTNRLDAQWSSEKISPLLTSEILLSSIDYFFKLESNVKVNYLISFLSLRKQLVKQLSSEIGKVLEVAKDDTDAWVKITAKVVELLLFSISPTPIVSFEDPSFTKIINLLQTKEKELGENHHTYFPMENRYLDKSLCNTPDSVKHFTVKPEAIKETFSWDEFDSGTGNNDTDRQDNKRNTHSKLGSSAPKLTLSSSRIFQHTPTTPRPSVMSIAHPPPSTPPANAATAASTAEKQNKMRVLDFTEVMELNQINQTKKRKRNSSQNDDEEERKRVKREQQDEAKRKRTEERQRKQEEAAQRKMMVEKEREQKRQVKLMEREAKQQAKIQQASMVKIHTPPAPPQKLPTTGVPNINPIIGSMGQEAAVLSQAIMNMHNNTASPSPLLFHSPTVFGNFTFKPQATISSPQLKPLQFHTTHPPAPPPPAPSSSTQQTLDSLFEDANMLSKEQRGQITDFLTGRCRTSPNPNQPIVEMLLNEKQVRGDDGREWSEQILFEINYTRCTWRKLRRRKPLNQNNNNSNPHVHSQNPNMHSNPALSNPNPNLNINHTHPSLNLNPSVNMYTNSSLSNANHTLPSNPNHLTATNNLSPSPTLHPTLHSNLIPNLSLHQNPNASSTSNHNVNINPNHMGMTSTINNINPNLHSNLNPAIPSINHHMGIGAVNHSMNQVTHPNVSGITSDVVLPKINQL